MESASKKCGNEFVKVNDSMVYQKEIKMSAIPTILVAVTLAVIAQLLIKASLNSIEPLEPYFSVKGLKMFIKLTTNPLFIVGFLAYIIATFFWLYSLTKVDLTFASPFLALTYVLIFLGAWIFLDENISFNRILGTLLVCLGLIIVSRS